MVAIISVLIGFAIDDGYADLIRYMSGRYDEDLPMSRYRRVLAPEILRQHPKLSVVKLPFRDPSALQLEEFFDHSLEGQAWINHYLERFGYMLDIRPAPHLIDEAFPPDEV